MRSTKFYLTKLVSSLVLLLLFMNVFSAFAQNTGPNITKPNADGCIDHNPGTVGSAYEYTYTGTGSNPVWTVKGDIQLLNGLNGTPVSSLAGPKAWIRSTANYGKGRLIVSFNQGICGPQAEYVDVYKVFSLLDQWPASNPDNSIYNNIVGPRCVEPSSDITYSINSVLSRNLGQEIGIDQYRWVFPASYTRTYVSSDSSSITLKAPATIGDTDEIKVYVGKCNSVPYVIKLYKAVPAPVITPIACVAPSATGTTTITLSVQNPNTTEYAYDWVLPGNSNWQFASGYDGLDEAQTGITIDNSVNSVKVVARRRTSVGGGCDETVSLDLKINRSLPTGSKLMGPVCADGSKGNPYTVTDANGTPLTGDFVWTFTEITGSTGFGFSVTNPTGPSVSFKAGTKGGVLTASRPGCAGNAVSLTITASPARPASFQAGPTCVDANSTGHVYTIDPVPGASSYTWTLGPGLTSSSTLVNGGTSITVNAGNTSGSNVSVVANNGTCASQPLLRTVTLNAVAPTSITATQSCINRNASDEVQFTAAFTTTPPAGQTYEWRVVYPTSVTTGWTVKGTSTNGSTVTATTGTSITYVTTGTVGSYRVEARAIRAGCAASAWVSSSALSTARSIAIGRQDLIDPDTDQISGEALIASFVSGATYRWTRTLNGVTTVLSATGNTLDLNTPGDVNNKANYCVTATINGCTTNTICLESQYNENTTGARLSSQTSPEPLSSQVVVYPNPATDGEFTLQLPAFKGKAGVVLKNLQGQVVYKTEVSKTKSKLSAGKLTSGVYLLQVSLDGKMVTKKVTVKK